MKKPIHQTPLRLLFETTSSTFSSDKKSKRPANFLPIKKLIQRFVSIMILVLQSLFIIFLSYRFYFRINIFLQISFVFKTSNNRFNLMPLTSAASARFNSNLSSSDISYWNIKTKSDIIVQKAVLFQ